MPALEGRAVVVTGGSSGIGRATVERFIAEGAQVVVVDLQPPPGGDAHAFIEADVGDPGAWPTIIEKSTAALGGIDIAYLNAGVVTGESDIGKLTDEQYHRIMRVNVDQVAFGVRALVEHMRTRGGGSILVTASIAGLIGFARDPVYTMTKHAVVGLVRSLGSALEPEGIKINAVCPGIVDTPLLGTDREVLEAAKFPLLDPSEIAAAALLAVTAGGAGLCYACQPGRPPEVYRFAGIPGPRTPGGEGVRPPL